MRVGSDFDENRSTSAYVAERGGDGSMTIARRCEVRLDMSASALRIIGLARSRVNLICVSWLRISK